MLIQLSSLILFSFPTLGKNLQKIEKIDVKMIVSGDLTGEYVFDGPMGSFIGASSNSTNRICEFSSLFRRLKYKGENSIESWLTLECVFEKQKRIYKTHRIYLQTNKPIQKVKLPMLDYNLKNVQLEFQELSVKLGK